jgi:hypothetical protein
VVCMCAVFCAGDACRNQGALAAQALGACGGTSSQSVVLVESVVLVGGAERGRLTWRSWRARLTTHVAYGCNLNKATWLYRG